MLICLQYYLEVEKEMKDSEIHSRQYSRIRKFSRKGKGRRIKKKLLLFLFLCVFFTSLSVFLSSKYPFLLPMGIHRRQPLRKIWRQDNGAAFRKPWKLYHAGHMLPWQQFDLSYLNSTMVQSKVTYDQKICSSYMFLAGRQLCWWSQQLNSITI